MLQCRFVHMLVDYLTLWQELEVNNTPCIKEHNQHDLAPRSANKKARNVEKQLLDASS